MAKIRRAGKAEDGADVSVLVEHVHGELEFLLIVAGAAEEVVRLVEDDGDAGDLGKPLAERVHLAERSSFLGVVERAVGIRVRGVAILEFLHDDLLGIRDEDEAEVAGLREAVDLFEIRVVAVELVAALGAEAVENLEVNEAAKLGGVALREHPRGIEIPNGLQRREDGCLRRLRRKDDEVAGKAFVARMQAREVQIEVDERGHQVGFPRAHRETEKVVRVNEIVEHRVEEGVPVFFRAERIVLHFFRQRLEFVFLCEAVEKFGGGIATKRRMRINLIAQQARTNDFAQRAIQPDELEPEIDFDALALRQAELPDILDVPGDLPRQRLGIRFLLRYPRERGLLNYVVKIHRATSCSRFPLLIPRRLSERMARGTEEMRDAVNW